jgi:hypothetical protein
MHDAVSGTFVCGAVLLARACSSNPQGDNAMRARRTA